MTSVSYRPLAGKAPHSGVFPAQLEISELSYGNVRGWLDSLLFYPKCQQRASWTCKLEPAARSIVAHSTVMSQDTGMAMTG